MSQSDAATELQVATSRLMRWRIPLLLALTVNVGMLARMVVVPDRAVAAPPTSAVASVPSHRPSGNSPAIEEATREGTAASSSGPGTPKTQSASDASELVPNWTELAANWWPAVELAAENATHLAAAHHSQTSTLSIENPQQNGVPVSFLVDARAYTLHPGESHIFPIGGSWDLQFHRGGALGNTRESLSPGTYRFVVSTEGWTVQPSH